MSSAAFTDNQPRFSSLQFGDRACAVADVADQSRFHWHKASGERGGDGGVACSDVADQSRFHWHKASGEQGADGGVACSAVADQSRFHWHEASGERGYREERASAEQPQLSAFPNSALAAVAFAATGFTPVEPRLVSYKPCPKTHPRHHRPRAGGAMTGQLQAATDGMTGQLLAAGGALTRQRQAPRIAMTGQLIRKRQNLIHLMKERLIQ